MSNKLVHIVDDDLASAKSIQALIMSRGWQAAVYHSAEEFLAAFESGTCRCLILDIRLEGMSGLELQKVLLSRGEAIPTIIISGYVDAPAHTEAVANGALAVLQ